MKKGENLFVVDLESVSFFNSERLRNIALDSSRYEKIPFLFLVASYLKNSSLSWANSRLKFQEDKNIGSWHIYKFQY